MGKGGVVKHVLALLTLMVFGILVVCADTSMAQEATSQDGSIHASLVGNGDFAASAVLWFCGTEVSANILGTICLNADLEIEDMMLRFNAMGALSGQARGNSDTLIGSGWAVFNARGSLDSGEAVILYGAIQISPDGIDLSSQTAGIGKGSLYTLIQLRDEVLHLRGAAAGTASGGFVKPDNPHTMQLAETGGFTFMATTNHQESDKFSEDLGLSHKGLSWSLDEWPQEIREAFHLMMEGESE
jgi:hypothetical protein